VDQDAALAMLDEVRGLLATNEVASARRMIWRCVQDLHEAFPVPITGEAKLARPIVRNAAEAARLCDDALALFRDVPADAMCRVQQLLYVIAELDGGERASHEVRDDRRRRTAFESVASGGYEMLRLPVRVVHPAMLHLAAQVLEVDIEQARHLLSDDAAGRELRGPRALASRLGAQLLVDAIPVIPIEDRPPLFFMARDRYSNPTRIEDPLTDIYERLRAKTEHHAGYVQMDAPQRVLDIDACTVQLLVFRYADVARRPLDIAMLDGWGLIVPSNRELFHTTAATDGAETMSLLWLGDDQIIVGRNGHAFIHGDNGVVRTFEIGNVGLQACDDAGRYIVVSNSSFEGFGCYDLDSGGWLKDMPPHIEPVMFLRQEDQDMNEEQFLIHNGRMQVCPLDRDVAVLAFSRGNRAALVFESDRYSIRSTETCFELVAPRCFPPAEALGEGAAAIAEVDGRWRFVLPSGTVADVDGTITQIEEPFEAASFSPDGRRLAVLRDGAIHKVDLP
jgi:hypothetical protein